MQPNFLKTCFFQQPRDASPPLVLAFCVSACWWRLVLEETQALMGATRLASGIVQLFSGFCMSFLFIFPMRLEAAKKCPTRDASPPLEVAFCGGVLTFRSFAHAQVRLRLGNKNESFRTFVLYFARLALTLLSQTIKHIIKQ